MRKWNKAWNKAWNKGWILHCVQNDERGVQNDERGVQNDERGVQNAGCGVLGMTIGFGVLLWSGVAGAQCITTQDCGNLGYKSLSCGSGKGIKCPFGNAWYCPCDGSYIYTCTRGNESPSSAKCGDKYSSCNCATGTSWKDDGCKADRASCAIGWIYYIDGTCVTPAAHNSSKVALGVVVHVNPDGIGGQVMAVRDVGAIVWGVEADIAGLPNYVTSGSASRDYDSCSNTDKIVAQGDSSIYPAAHAARNYSPTTETIGKWCLPAAGIITNIYNNQSAVQAGISKLGGIAFQRGTWSSSEYNRNIAWYSNFNYSYGLYNYDSKGSGRSVRPVLAF